VTLNKTTRTFTPEDGIITVPRFASHEWRRANSEGEELVVKEWTGPVDGEKQIFFRNLSSVILDVRKMDRLLSGGSPGSFSLYFRDWTTILFSEIRIAPVDWQHLRGADNACCDLCGSLAGEARWTEERLRRVTPSKYSTGLVKEGSEAKVKGD
jgi:hypothetical protein